MQRHQFEQELREVLAEAEEVLSERTGSPAAGSFPRLVITRRSPVHARWGSASLTVQQVLALSLAATALVFLAGSIDLAVAQGEAFLGFLVSLVPFTQAYAKCRKYRPSPNAAARAPQT